MTSQRKPWDTPKLCSLRLHFAVLLTASASTYGSQLFYYRGREVRNTEYGMRLWILISHAIGCHLTPLWK